MPLNQSSNASNTPRRVANKLGSKLQCNRGGCGFMCKAGALDKIKNPSTPPAPINDMRCNTAQVEWVQLFSSGWKQSLNWKSLLLTVGCLQKSEIHTCFQLVRAFLYHRSYRAMSSISNTLLQSTTNPGDFLPSITRWERSGHLLTLETNLSPLQPSSTQEMTGNSFSIDKKSPSLELKHLPLKTLSPPLVFSLILMVVNGVLRGALTRWVCSSSLLNWTFILEMHR